MWSNMLNNAPNIYTTTNKLLKKCEYKCQFNQENEQNCIDDVIQLVGDTNYHMTHISIIYS